MNFLKRYYLHLAFALFLAALFMWSTFMISTGILLGCFTLAGFIVLYKRIALLESMALRFPALFDIGAALLTYLLFGQTIIGLIAAAVVGLGTSMLLDIQLVSEQTKQKTRAERIIEALSAI